MVESTKEVELKAWSPDRQWQHRLGTCQKHRFLSLSQTYPESETLGAGPKYSALLGIQV